MKTVAFIVIIFYVIIIAWNVYELKHAQNIDKDDPNF